MHQETTLLATLAAGLGLAFLLGFVANRLRLPALVGYLVAGVVIGPFTPGYVANVPLASQLAEVGVILLMFGVGLHFSLRDLIAVRQIALPGAVAQIAAATALGTAVARAWGWSWGAGLVFGMSLSVASTVVLLRALEERGAIDSTNGRIAVGWLIVEDLATVVALVLLPALAVPLGGTAAPGTPTGGSALLAVALTLGKAGAFLAVMLIAGRRFVPWLLERVARTGSRELFTLAVLAMALGVAVGAAALFGVSLALGAFFAGVVISESDLSHQAAADALPLQDAFAVLFFVSVGMLFDPTIILRRPLELLGVVLIIIVGKSAAAFAIVLLFRYPVRTALTVSASLAQIGEFSFILAALGVSLRLLPAEGQTLILAAALLTITLNPLSFAAADAVERWLRARPRILEALERVSRPLTDETPRDATMTDHVVIVGYGRVGRTIGEALAGHGIPYMAVERDHRIVEGLRQRGVPALFGDGARPGILEHADIAHARLLVVTAPEPFQARQIMTLARQANPTIDSVVRTHTVEEHAYLEQIAVGRVVMGERELALSMTHYALRSLGRSEQEADDTIQGLRQGVSAG
jgi:CPA2 family monovalent cation:H+ antiporter-2